MCRRQGGPGRRCDTSGPGSAANGSGESVCGKFRRMRYPLATPRRQYEAPLPLPPGPAPERGPVHRPVCWRSAALLRPDDRAATLATADHTVVSVGPYMFQTARQRRSSWLATPPTGFAPAEDFQARSAGPARRQHQPQGRAPPARRSRRPALPAGPAPRRRRSFRRRRSPRAPRDSGRNISSPLMSNASVVFANSTCLRCREPRAPCGIPGSRKLVSARCGTSTPLGPPGRARGVDHVGEIVRTSRQRPSSRRLIEPTGGRWHVGVDRNHM